MITQLRSFHAIAAQRGDGLLPEFLSVQPHTEARLKLVQAGEAARQASFTGVSEPLPAAESGERSSAGEPLEPGSPKSE